MKNRFGHFMPEFDQPLLNLRFLSGEVAQFGAIFRQIVKFPRVTPEADQFPIAIAQAAIITGKELNRGTPRQRFTA